MDDQNRAADQPQGGIDPQRVREMRAHDRQHIRNLQHQVSGALQYLRECRESSRRKDAIIEDLKDHIRKLLEEHEDRMDAEAALADADDKVVPFKRSTYRRPG